MMIKRRSAKYGKLLIVLWFVRMKVPLCSIVLLEKLNFDLSLPRLPEKCHQTGIVFPVFRCKTGDDALTQTSITLALLTYNNESSIKRNRLTIAYGCYDLCAICLSHQALS
jgi:hypothetical protein